MHLKNCRKKGHSKEIKCMECDKAFRHRHNLVYHVKTVHLKANATKCDLCDGKTFSTKGGLNAHVQSVHLGQDQERIKCTYCTNTFSFKSSLLNHIKSVHFKMYQVTCDICEKTFSCQPSLKSHMKTVHHQIRDCVCTECERTFSQREDLNHHIRAVHLKLRPFECDFCEGKTFARKKDLTAHMVSCHGEGKEEYKGKSEPLLCS